MKSLICFTVFVFSSLAFAKNHEIRMYNKHGSEQMVYVPGFLKVKKGDSITFIPAKNANGHNSKSSFGPGGFKAWESEFNKKFTVTLDKEGVYVYECSAHKAMGMVGVIQVGSAVNLSAAKSFKNSFKKKIFMNKGRLDGYFQKVGN